MDRAGETDAVTVGYLRKENIIMRLNFNSVTQNQFYNVYRINQSAAQKSGKANDASAEIGRAHV